ncbi:hypothetical protein [Chryseolinea lacunae]|uniref:Prolyl-tRNA synthetase n=1 Tax=Chryseolinea lacunae TaxID=2801331 RepID=A0ABS1KS76_9BACT|nr:hypothetical protein [Chryseolinea lacunae]MBL0742338.1 hypothetical protein [Chryseolinea lacunae]
MKTKVIMLSFVASLAVATSFAQGIENDDMYFNSKDRAKVKALRAKEDESYSASAKKANKYTDENSDVVNPTDSYSARNVNPEFAARSNAQTAKADEQDYFVSNYKYSNASKISSFNNSYNSWYNNPWYSSNYYSPSIYGWNSPYYGSYYDMYGNPWMNPYYQSGWSSSYSYYMGSNWNYGWGSGFGMGLSYGNPYCYGSPYMNSWGSSFGYGGYYNNYYGGGYYPTNVVIINNGYEGGRNIAYGKRATRSGMMASTPSATNGRTRPDNNSNYVTTYPSRQSSNGRVDTQSRIQRQEDYYNRSYRTQQQQAQQQQAPQYSSPSRTDWGNSGQSHYNSGGRSDSNFGSGSGTRSSGGTAGGGSFSGSGSNGRSRGRD